MAHTRIITTLRKHPLLTGLLAVLILVAGGLGVVDLVGRSDVLQDQQVDPTDPDEPNEMRPGVIESELPGIPSATPLPSPIVARSSSLPTPTAAGCAALSLLPGVAASETCDDLTTSLKPYDIALPSLPDCQTAQINLGADNAEMSGKSQGISSYQSDVDEYVDNSRNSPVQVKRISQIFELRGMRTGPQYGESGISFSFATIIYPELTGGPSTIHFFGWHHFMPDKENSGIGFEQKIPLSTCNSYGKPGDPLAPGRYRVWVVPFGHAALGESTIVASDEYASTIDIGVDLPS